MVNPKENAEPELVRRNRKKVKKKKIDKPPREYKVDGSLKKKSKFLSTEEKQARALVTAQALELRMAGTSYAQIATALSLSSPMQAKRYCDGAIEKVEVDAAKNVVAMDLARLDEFQMRATHALRQNGDLSQIDRIMRIMDKRYQLLGISDETVRQLQSEHGISTTTVNNHNQVMVVQASPETENEFIAKMMRSVGVDPDSDAAQEYLKEHAIEAETRTLPLLAGSANDTKDQAAGATTLSDEEIVEGEIM